MRDVAMHAAMQLSSGQCSADRRRIANFTAGLLAAACAWWACTAVAAEPAADPRGLEIFTTKLRPLLAHRCAGCHGAGTVESDFDMSTREKLLAGGASGPAIVPGRAGESLMYRLAARLEEPHMPEEGDALTTEELGWLADWIDRGAPFDKPLVDDSDRGPWTERVVKPGARDFWAFRPLAATAPPQPADPQGWCRNPIDRFILAKLAEAGIAPSPEAPPQTLYRRLSFDLTGLPATPREIAAFCAAATQDATAAYDRAVDDFLARESFGERWAQHWLDVARFAESFGYEQDYDRPHAHHYRDFVIKAFNEDLPYDMFLRWQLAGDELAPGHLDAQKATGFLAAGAFPTQLTEKEFESARSTELDDMVATVGTAMLGATIGCARCHDHKFDPFPQADYYRLAATFTTTIRSNVDLPLDPAKDREILAAWEARRQAAVQAREAYERDELPQRFEAFVATWRPAADPTGQEEPSPWRLGSLVSVEMQSGRKFAPLDDGSLLAVGEPADRDSYTFVIDVPLESVGSLRLDAIADPALPRGGPGRAGNGNFALSNLTVAASPLPAAGTPAAKPVPVKLVNPRADFSQTKPSLLVGHAIDSSSTSAWAVDPEVGASHVAAFDFEKPVHHAGGVRLTVMLEFMNNAQHTIGRPRISFAAAPQQNLEPVRPDRDPIDALRESRLRLDELLAKPATDRSQADHAELAALHRTLDDGWRSLDKAVRRLDAEKPAPRLVKVLVASENVPKIPHHADGRGYPHFYPETHFLRRGDVNQKEGVATTGFLQVLTRHPEGAAHWLVPAPAGATTSHRRAALARWITDSDHGAGHVAARVIVNRLWQHHFGEGLVATPSDFGKQADPPSHPELLDWLAGELIRSGWQLKPIHRLMVSSAAYRQSSAIDPAKAKVDPANRLVWRFNRRRLEGEAIRDTLLALSGSLDPMLYGRAGREESSPRRSLYLERKRSKLPLFLRTFDSPDFVSGVAKRSVTTTAPQALAMMNSPQVRTWAGQFAKQLVAEAATIPGVPPLPGQPQGDATADASPQAQVIRAAYATAVGRAATPTELHDAKLFIDSQQAAYAAAGRSDGPLAALTDFCQVLMGLNETMHIE
jgi:hypothetical protein